MISNRRLNISYDHQIFSIQNFGGISKCFAMYVREFGDNSLNVNAQVDVIFTSNHHLRENNTNTAIYLPDFPGSIRFKLFANRVLTSENFGKVDVYHPTFYFPQDFSKINGKPIVTTVHDMTPELFPFYFKKGNPHLSKKDYVYNSKVTVCVSETTREDLIRIYGIEREKTKVVYHGIDLFESEQNCRIKKGLPENFLLYVGKRTGYKNFKVLINAFPQLLKRHKNLNLICVGGGSFNQEESLRFKELGLGNQIHQINATDSELRGMYKAAKAFVFPSKYEGFGIPILEAFAQHCPVVLSEMSCFPEIAGDAGIYFDPDNIDSCTRAIDKAISNGTNKLTKLAYKRAKDFTWKAAAQALSEIYHNLV